MIGFAGAPWTVATYMVAGQGSRDQAETRRLAYLDPGQFTAIIERIGEVPSTICRARSKPEPKRSSCSTAGREPRSGRVRALGDRPDGAAGRAAEGEAPKRAGNRLSQGRGGKLGAYARETGVDAIGLDETVDPAWADTELPKGMPVQGNLDPLALVAGGEPLRSSVARILKALAERPHIFNLGHGILQDTPDRPC